VRPSTVHHAVPRSAPRVTPVASFTIFRANAVGEYLFPSADHSNGLPASLCQNAVPRSGNSFSQFSSRDCERSYGGTKRMSLPSGIIPARTIRSTMRLWIGLPSLLGLTWPGFRTPRVTSSQKRFLAWRPAGARASRTATGAGDVDLLFRRPWVDARPSQNPTVRF
jgi:hypothetical protein